MTLKFEQNPKNCGTGGHEKTREDTRRHGKAQEGTARHEKARARGHRARNVSYSTKMGPLKCKYLSTLVSPDQAFAKEVDSVCVCVCVCVGGGDDLVCR